MSFETAIYQWQQGERRLQASPAQRSALLERVIAALVAELRRRLGGRFSTQELVDLYDGGTMWCLQLAMKVAPDDPWAWDAGVVVDRRPRTPQVPRGPVGLIHDRERKTVHALADLYCLAAQLRCRVGYCALGGRQRDFHLGAHPRDIR